MARITVNTVQDNMNILNNELKTLLKDDFSNDKRSAWYMLMYPVARLLREKMERQQIQAEKMNLLNCEGIEIDEHLANSPFFFKRKQESQATVKIELIGGVNVTLETGDVIVEANDGIRYTLSENGILNNKTTFEFTCDTAGEQGNKEIGSIIKLVKVVNGVYDFKQNEIAAGGQEQESDNDYIERWFLSRNESEWNLDGIRAEVLKQEGVKSVYADENKTMTVDSKGLEPKSIVLIVDGGRNEDIANAIWKKKDQAIQMNGDTVVTVKDNQGIDREIRFYRPKKREVQVKIEFQKADGVNILEENLRDIVKEYIKSVKVGEYITSYKCESEFIRTVYSADKLLNVDITFKFKETPGIVFEKVLKLRFNEVAEYVE
ncbi:MAG: baseplate J/gp47 family protein [Leptotrichia hongkongensis]